jgi:hypothetical protein
MNTYYIKFPDEKNILVSPLISMGETSSNYCLQFWYHMFSDYTALIGLLKVDIIESNTPNVIRPLWSRAGRQEQNHNQWLLAEFDFTAYSTFRIAFTAQRHFQYFGDIGIDDIAIANNKCENPTNQKCKFIFENY